MRTIQTKDGITVQVADGVTNEDPALRAYVAELRASGAKEGTYDPSVAAAPAAAPTGEAAALAAAAQQAPSPTGVPAAPPPSAAAQFTQDFAGAMPGNLGAVARGVAGGLAAPATMIADPLTMLVNKLLPANLQQLPPSQGIQALLSAAGVPDAETEAQKILQAATAGLAGGVAQVGVGTAMGALPGVAGRVGKVLASQPVQQMAGGMGAGLASEAAAQAGAGPLVQFGAGLAGGAIGSGLAGAKVAPSPTGPVKEAAEVGVPLMTSDVRPPKFPWLRTFSEKVPITGTAPLRAAQQTKRIEAVKDLVRQYRAEDLAGVMDDVMDDLLATRRDSISKWTKAKREVIDSLGQAIDDGKDAASRAQFAAGGAASRYDKDVADLVAAGMTEDQADGLLNLAMPKNKQAQLAALKDPATRATLVEESLPWFADLLDEGVVDTNKVRAALESPAGERFMVTAGGSDGDSLASLLDLDRGFAAQAGIELDDSDARSFIKTLMEEGDMSRKAAAQAQSAAVDDLVSLGVPKSVAIKAMNSPDGGRAARAYVNLGFDKIEQVVAADPTFVSRAIRSRSGGTTVKVIAPAVLPTPTATKVIDDAIGRISALDYDANKPLLKEIESFKRAIQGKDITQIETLRAQLGERLSSGAFADVKDLADKVTSAIYPALNDDMSAYIKEFAGDAAYNKWKVANKELSNMLENLDLAPLKNALNKGELTPEVVKNLLFSSRRSDVAALYRELSPAGRARARSAVIAKAAEKALTNTESATDILSPDKFVFEVKKMGAQRGVLFSGQDLKQLDGLTRVLEYTKHAAKAGAGSSPAAGLMQVALPAGAAALSQAFGSGIKGFAGAMAAGAGAGAIARAYESPFVRDILTKLPTVRAGSPEEAALIKRLIEAVTAMQRSSAPDVK